MNTKMEIKSTTKLELQRSLFYLSLLADLLVDDIYKPVTDERKIRVRDNLKEMVSKSKRCLQMIETNTN